MTPRAALAALAADVRASVLLLDRRIAPGASYDATQARINLARAIESMRLAATHLDVMTVQLDLAGLDRPAAPAVPPRDRAATRPDRGKRRR